MKINPVILFCLLPVMCLAQVENQSELTIDQIMQGEDFVGYLPENIRWSDDSRLIYFSGNPEKDTLRSTYKADIASGKVTKLTNEEIRDEPASGDFTRDYTWKVYEKSGDIFLENLSDFTVTRITSTNARESDPEFSGDEQSIFFRENENLYTWSRTKGTFTQLTDFRSGKEQQEQQNKQEKWLAEDALENSAILVKRKNESEARKHQDKNTSFERPKTIYTGKRKIRGLSVSPDLRYVVYRLMVPAEDKNTNVPDYVTSSGFTEDKDSRTKVGGPQDTYESWILDNETDSAYQISTDSLKGIFDKPAFLEKYANDSTYSPTYDKPREVNISQPVFSEDGKAVVNITSQDYKDRWIALVDLPTGNLKVIDRQHDDAWIGGPQVGWFGGGTIEWIDNEWIWFKSEKTGYAHVYRANVINGKISALTSGEFEVLDARLSRDRRMFYLTTNEASPHEQHFYHLPATGGKMKRVTTLKGGHEVTVSPDEKQLAIRYSYSNKPWELYVMPNKAGGKMVQLTESTTKSFKAYNWRDPEIIHFKARDGVSLPATLYKPTEDRKNGAAVIFVHGAGYLQNVHYWWPSYFREYMFNNILADNGYTVLAIDFRASAGYGRDWRTAIYRHMGGKDLEDQVDGANYLVEQLGIDKDRIGLYGGSYGGFITLMALFKNPETFASGAALRSVTDWAHYNHGYTANILNTPTEDSIAYAQSSPIYFAEGLQGHLLMLHGMIDTNVHFQDIVRLSQRLIELKKENWELAVFPLESHGFVESSSWSDEYRRIYELFWETLRE